MSSLFSIFKARPLHLLTKMTIGSWQTMESMVVVLGLIVVILGLQVLGLEILGLETLDFQVLGDTKIGAGSIYRDLYAYRYSDVDRYFALGHAFLDAYVSKRIMNNCCDVNKPSFGSIGSNGTGSNGTGSNGIGSNGIGSNSIGSNSIGSNSIGQAWGQNGGQTWLIFDRTQHSPRTTKSNQDGLIPA